MEPRGVSLASRVHAAPALLRDTTNERGARDDADDAQTSKSRWKKVATLGLAFAGNLAGGGSAAGANALVATETWQDATSSEDEGSVRRYEHSDDSDVDAEGIETELTAAVPPSCKTFDASSKNDHAEFYGAHATDVVWAYQNLRRVPPGLWRAFHPERLRALDVSHNALTSLPSALGRFVNLESLDCSSNRIKKLPPSLARCRRLATLVASRNRLRRLGGWTCTLPKLKRLECEENPECLDPPPSIVNLGGLAVLEYLRAANVAHTWKPDAVVDLSRFATAEREASRVSLEAATRETRRHERTRDMDMGSVFCDIPGPSDTSRRPSRMAATQKQDEGFALTVAWLRDASVPARGTERARRVLKETATRNAGVDLRYVAFRPGFFATFRRVAKIDLTDARLVSLPPALGTLCAHLETLILDGNSFCVAPSPKKTRETEGETADVSCAVPDLTRLPKLKTLSMRNCKNITTLPPWIGRCAALETLVVSTCALRAAPAGVEGSGPGTDSSRVREKFLDSSRVRETLPSLRGASSLRTLDVSRNGKLRSLPRLPSCLRTLNCSECALEDFANVTDAAELRELDAHENRASRLPEDLADLDFLRAFDVRRNFLKSLDAPNMARRARFFTKLHFSSNPLAHTPWWLADVPSEALEPRAELEKRVAFEVRDLYRADAGGDDFYGVDDGRSLSSFGDDDSFSKTPRKHASRATKIDLRSRGVLYAPSLSQFSSSLTHLVLSGNHLAFLPEHVSECVFLRVLDASRNELAFLPDLGRLGRLEDLRASENRLQKLPDSLSACVSLRSLYVGKNPELETVPDLKACVSLETLVIDACALRVLPVTLAAAPRLTRLYVEGNPLTFPGPEVYEKGGNPAVLKFIRDVHRTAEESREMREAREAFRSGAEEEKKKGVASNASNASNASDESSSRAGWNDADASGAKPKPKPNQTSLGALLWRDARRVVVRDSSRDSSRYEDGAFDAENALLRAREMTAGVRAAEAEKRLDASVAELESVLENALEFGEEVKRLVGSVRSLRSAAEEQRRLLAKFPTMATDFLAALQVRTRDEKKALREALQAKDAADENALRLRARVAEREATFAALTEAVRAARAAKEEVSVRRREAIMRSRAKSVSETRKTATEGAAKALEAELVSQSLRKTSRAAVKRESSRRRMGGEHFDLGLRRADVTEFKAIEDKANKAWGRAQAALWMGAFRKPTIRAEYSAAETFPGSDREGRGRTQ